MMLFEEHKLSCIIVKVKIILEEPYNNHLTVMGADLLDSEPKLEGLKKFVNIMKENEVCNILDVKYTTRELTEHDNPKTYGVTVH